MQIDILTIFPEMFAGVLGATILKRAQQAGALAVATHDIRAFATDKHHSVDDLPYGGGAGMVMKPEPLVAAIESIAPRAQPFARIALCAQGRVLTQAVVRELAAYQHLVLVCGRYEGIDERVYDGWIDQAISIGDFVVSGGEIPAMVVVDAVTRMLPGVLGNADSLCEESHTAGLLEYPQYTRPPIFRDREVPAILQSGNHQAIARWRQEQSVERTKIRRPDLYEQWMKQQK